MEKNNGFNEDVVFFASTLLAVTCLVLILLGLTDLGQVKAFRFVIGEVAVVTAITFGFQAAQRSRILPLFSAAIWFFTASLQFAMAVWSVAK